MTDTEDGPDPNDVRRHAKKMLTELQYRQRYRRIDYYRPNLKQLEWHNLSDPEKMLRAGNQQGKTHAGAAEMGFHALGLYPEWYAGRRFETPPRIERPYDFIGWAGCTTSGKTRDGVQVKLLGDVRQQGGLGTGMIPLDNIVGRPTMARGISDFVDTVSLRREGGGTAVIRFKTFEMGRPAWQGEPVDVVWGDEDPDEGGGSGPPPGEIYSECQARLTTTDGQIIWTMTPMVGLSPIRKHYKAHAPGTREVLMTIEDAAVSRGGHIPDEKIPGIIARYGKKAATRAYGADMLGQGSVFEVEEDRIKHRRDWAEFPPSWAWLWALDFRHSGTESAGGHPFAAVLGAWDRDNDAIYVVEAIRMYGLAANHVARIREHPLRDAPVAWPHDGGLSANRLAKGETIALTYKKLGLNMRPQHATFPTGGYGFEDGITLMEERFGSDRLKVAAHLTEWFDEYLGYHRINGLVHKIDDDLLSASRVLCMDIRHAKVVERFRAIGRAETQAAIGSDFDLFTGEAFA